MAKLVCHGQKCKKGNVASLERHNERKNKKYSNQEIDTDRSMLNYDLIQRADESYYRSMMNLVDERYNPTGRKLRSDAVVLCEFIISSSNDFFESMPEEEQRRYFEESCRYLEDTFGKKNCIYAVVHNDEHTPHMHFGFVPLTEDNRLCAKKVLDRSVLLRLQSDMPRYLKSKGFSIERGEADSQAVHRSVREYKADMEREKIELAESISSQKEELKQIASVKSDIQTVSQIPTGRTILGGKLTMEESDYERILRLAKKQLAYESKERSLAKELAALKKENRALQSTNQTLHSQLVSEKSLHKKMKSKEQESELNELRRFKQAAEKFMSEHGLLDYFKKLFIHSNKLEH